MGGKAFFSFTEVPDPARHRDYNAWHQLDHRPENLALPGVRYGERWVRSPDCVAAAGSTAIDALARLHYVNMYWFNEPVEESFRAWQGLADGSFQWGRRTDVGIARRLMMGSFLPVKGYVNPTVLVSPDVLPLRPNRGVVITVTRLVQPRSVAAHDRFAWYDREYLPRLVAQPGVAGAWTFASQSTTLDEGFAAASGSVTFDQQADREPGRYRILLVYVDGDPLDHAAAPAPDPVEEVALHSVLRAITPWQWDWFD